MAATEDKMGTLHEAVVSLLLQKVLDGTATPAELSTAVKMLKDNNIEAIPTESKPSKPKPTTATVSPTWGFPSRKPCMAIAPTVPNAPDSKSTASGRGTTRLTGTTAYSAWTA